MSGIASVDPKSFAHGTRARYVADRCRFVLALTAARVAKLHRELAAPSPPKPKRAKPRWRTAFERARKQRQLERSAN